MPPLGRRVVIAGWPLLVGAVAGCGQNSAHSAGPSAAPPAVVTVSQPVSREITDYAEFTGRTVAVDSVDIRARVTGFLMETHFTDGDEAIEADQLLFVIDERPFIADRDAAAAALSSAQAHQEQKDSDYERVKQLRDKGQVSLEEFDRAQAQKQEADAEVKGREADLSKAELNLSFCRIKSPIAGRISKAQITDGNLVTADSTLLTNIVSEEQMRVEFDFDERTILRIHRMIREGQLRQVQSITEVPLQLGLANDPGYPFEGHLDFVDNRVDPATGTIPARGIFENPKPEVGHRPLSPGLFAHVRVRIGQPHPALLITERAIGRDQGQTFVYVVGDGDEVASRTVRLGTLHEGLRVIEEGLTLEDRVIVNGLQRVRPGVQVTPRPVEMEP